MGIIDRFPLTREVFEDKLMSVGAKKQQIFVVFRKTPEEMNEWCRQEYGMDFDTVYELMKQMVFAEWKETLKALGEKGNPTAMAYVCNKLDEEDGGGIATISFNVNLRTENDNDKLSAETTTK